MATRARTAFARLAFLGPALAVVGASPTFAQTPSFTMIGHPFPSGGSLLYGLSADGRTAAGYSVNNTGPARPGLRWSVDSGRTDFGFEPGLPAATISQGLSGDGSTVVGYTRGPSAASDSPRTAFRWSGSGTFQSLGTMPGYTHSFATGVSNDGSIIAGHVSAGIGVAPRAFRWTQGTGIQYIGSEFTQANAISRNGNVIVGEFDVNSGNNKGYFWTQATGMQPLASLDGSIGSYARGVSADGSYIVGVRTTSNDSLPTLWHNNVPMDLGTPPGVFDISPLAVSDDGSVVVGQYTPEGGTFASVWTAATGFMSLRDYLTANGVTIPAGVLLQDCRGVSADGRTFVGSTFGPAGIVEGYVATIPAPGALSIVALSLLAAGRRRRRS
jgi:uncharacterized membrane protein